MNHETLESVIAKMINQRIKIEKKEFVDRLQNLIGLMTPDIEKVIEDITKCSVDCAIIKMHSDRHNDSYSCQIQIDFNKSIL